jgi:hypothetical protein
MTSMTVWLSLAMGDRPRADQQHAWVMQDDPRGTYGESVSAT